MRIGLVGCVKGKRSSPAHARDLYTSALFLGRRRFVERTCDQWFVLSAKHGLVEPDRVLEPFDQTLNDASTAERRRWSEQVVGDLSEVVGDLHGIVFEAHAGKSYLDYGLAAGIERRGGIVHRLTDGMTFGRQLAFYKATGQ